MCGNTKTPPELTDEVFCVSRRIWRRNNQNISYFCATLTITIYHTHKAYCNYTQYSLWYI